MSAAPLDPAHVPGSGRSLAAQLPVALVAVFPAFLAVAAALSLNAPEEGKSDFIASGVAVSLGIFGVLLTAVTIALALVVNVGSRWPSLGDLVRHALLSVWFGLAFLAVLIAVLSQALQTTILVIPAIGLSLTGALVGLFSVYRVLSVSGGAGQHDLLTGLLTEAISRETDFVSSRAPSLELEPYLNELDAAIDRAEIDPLQARLLELHDATIRLPKGKEWLALDLVCRLVDRLGRAMLTERVESEVARTLLPELLETASRLTARGAVEDEVRASAYLGQLSRTLAWLHGAADTRIVADSGKVGPMRRLMVTSLAERRAIGLSVHPDPPHRPDVSALTEGFTEPLPAIVWWWGFLDFNGSGRSQAMYAFYAALVGERFGSSHEARSVLQELVGKLRSPRWPAAREARRIFDRHGGVECCLLELAVTALAVTRPLDRATPAGMNEFPDLSTDEAKAWRTVRLVTDQKLDDADDALAKLAHLLGTGGRRLATLVTGEYSRLEGAVSPRLIASAERPAACVLACALPFAFTGDAKHLREFSERLPEPLLRGALDQAARRFRGAPPDTAGLPRTRVENRFVTLLLRGRDYAVK